MGETLTTTITMLKMAKLLLMMIWRRRIQHQMTSIYCKFPREDIKENTLAQTILSLMRTGLLRPPNTFAKRAQAKESQQYVPECQAIGRCLKEDPREQS